MVALSSKIPPRPVTARKGLARNRIVTVSHDHEMAIGWNRGRCGKWPFVRIGGIVAEKVVLETRHRAACVFELDPVGVVLKVHDIGE